MERVNVFIGVYDGVYERNAHMPRKRLLNEDTVHRAVGIELADKIDQLALRCGLREKILLRYEAALFTGELLVFYIYLRSGVFADQYDGETRSFACFPGKLQGFLLYLSADVQGDGFAVKDLSRHQSFSFPPVISNF